MQDQQPNSHEQPRNSSQNERRIAERVVILLSHFWLTSEDQAMRKAQLADWLDALKPFTAIIVADACRHWVRSESKRPAPADIVRLCREVQPEKPQIGMQPSTAQHVPPPSDPNIVRPNWRTIVYWQLSDAEKRLFREAAGDTMSRYGFASEARST